MICSEHFDYLMERLFEEGALDVSLQSLQMKKNRPGFLVRVLARPSDRDALARIVFAESTAIGVRVSEWDRLVLERTKKRLKTPLGSVSVKLIRSPEGDVDCSPEYDDCKRLARKHGLPLREVVERVRSQARQKWANEGARVLGPSQVTAEVDVSPSTSLRRPSETRGRPRSVCTVSLGPPTRCAPSPRRSSSAGSGPEGSGWRATTARWTTWRRPTGTSGSARRGGVGRASPGARDGLRRGSVHGRAHEPASRPDGFGRRSRRGRRAARARASDPPAAPPRAARREGPIKGGVRSHGPRGARPASSFSDDALRRGARADPGAARSWRSSIESTRRSSWHTVGMTRRHRRRTRSASSHRSRPRHRIGRSSCSKFAHAVPVDHDGPEFPRGRRFPRATRGRRDGKRLVGPRQGIPRLGVGPR